ncbi:magnesium transporter [Myroides injenensis]|uniref:magnesium transporter n=1 Tax=Myroides injenensis TaxID=1183151 RepID=UPI00226E4786|nr:magnesium transporter [Myroides injenensis]
MKRMIRGNMQLQKIAKDFQGLEQMMTMIPMLKKMPIIDISETLSLMENKDLLVILNEFSVEEQGNIFAEFALIKQLTFFQQISKKRFSKIFEEMPSDARADLFQILTQQEQIDLLPFLSKKIREDVLALSTYPSDTAGGIMITDFATVSKEMTCFEAIQKVRFDAPSKKTIYYVYVVDEAKTLLGFITLKDLIIAEPDDLVSALLHSEFIFGFVEEASELIAAKIDKYELVALPILNNRRQLIGIVTHDEAMDVIQAEHTEDMERFMGIMSSNEDSDYNRASVFSHFKRRVVWLVSLALIGVFAGLIIHKYEAALLQVIILVLYMPMVAGTGGNAGSQSATVIIRALALGQVTVKSWFKVLWKETRISLMLALCLGVLAFVLVLFLSWSNIEILPFTIEKIGFVVAVALSLQVISSTIIGATLPLVVKRFGGDPAVVASPAIATIVDISGLLIYFSIASYFFNI